MTSSLKSFVASKNRPAYTHPRELIYQHRGQTPTQYSVTTAMSTAAFPPLPLVPLVTQIAALLTARKQTVCVAETAAGGLISAALLSVPGASRYYKGGLTVYTLASRITYAGWTEQDLEGYAYG